MRIAIFGAALLTGCAKTSAVIPVTGGAFEVTADASAPAEARDAAYAAAKTYCEKYRIKPSVINFRDQPGASTLLFRCAESY